MAWTVRRIKAAHDVHWHYIAGKPVEHPPCPACPMCKCPVHRADPHAVTPTEATANAFTQQ